MAPEEAFAAFAAVLAAAGVAIGVLILIGRIFKRLMDHKERQLGLTADRTAEKAAQYASQVEQLEARVRVLERIATDKGADLAQQIEDLRDAGLPTVRIESRETN